jgi:hypothetical protein
MDERVVDQAAVMDAAESQAAVLFGVWKAQVRPGSERGGAAPFSPRLIAEIISSDLAQRDVQAAREVPSLSDQGWLDLVHSTYYVRAGATT